MPSIQSTAEIASSGRVRSSQRSWVARVAITAMLSLLIGLGLVAAGHTVADSASGGPGNVFSHGGGSGGSGVVYVVAPDSASGGPGNV